MPAQDHHPLAGREAGDALQPHAAPRVVVDWAMRYGKPAIAAGSRRWSAQGCDRILVVPLYPQYCARRPPATVCDEVFRALMPMRWQPALRIAPPYYDDPVYIEALAVLDAAPRSRSSISSRR